MSASFDGVSFGERGNGATSFPVWSVEGTVIVKKIPGGDKNVIQVIGNKLPRLAFIAKCTAAQLASLRTKAEALTTGTLDFSFETCTATLVSVTDAQEVGAGHDVYFATLNFIRSSARFTIPDSAWETEAGSVWETEAGGVWETEA